MPVAPADWLQALLARNAGCAYLRSHGSPRDLAAFRRNVPVVAYEALEAEWLPRIVAGEADVLFAGRPCAFERTGGSSGGAKLIPYSGEGLADFQSAVAPWLAATVDRFRIAHRVYLATSPATRPQQAVGGVPVGLPDGAYLGAQWGLWVAAHSAVPLEVGAETDVARWRARTLQALSSARDLEMVSVWSPTFFLRLLDDLPDPRKLWPALRLVSCWADGASRGPAQELRARLPQAHLQPKGLLSTECVATVPDAQDRPVLNPHGFFEFEFEREGRLSLAGELQPGETCEVIATTASGLYRYRTGDLVQCDGFAAAGQPVLRFIGRAGIASDLVGEKLVEAFADAALRDVPGFRFLLPLADEACYAVVAEAGAPVDLARIEARLLVNPQYEHARRMRQLGPLRHLPVHGVFDRYAARQLARGVRLADIKPVALVRDGSWLA